MKTKSNLILLCLLAILILPFNMDGQTVKTITFQEGEKTAVVDGVVKGRNFIDYKLTANAGQKMAISLDAKSTSIYFNLLPPGSDNVAVYNSSVDGNKYNGTAEKKGEYTVRVYLMGSAGSGNKTVSFKLTAEMK